MSIRVARSPADIVAALRDALEGGPAVLPAPSDAALTVAAVDATIDDDIALLVPTSGSTRAPKIVELSASALVASAVGTEQVLGGSGEWLLCLPLEYIAGVQVVVRSLLHGAPPVTTPDGPFRPDAFVAAARAMSDERRYVSLVPTQLGRLLDDAAATTELQRFAGVLVGGAATSPALLDRARTAGVAVRTTYGMSETSGGCVYDGLPLPGVSVELDADGRIDLAGPMLARRYRGDRDATAEAFVDGRFRTADLGRVDDGVLHVLGRVDDVIVTGGRKVLPLEVAAAAAPHVADVFVTGVPDPQWGAAVTAWLVPPDGADAPTVVAAVQAAVRSAVGAFAVPHTVHVVDTIPLLPSGKPDRLSLLASVRP